MIGEQIGDYVIEGELGKGGMGSVVLGIHRSTNERVAIKILSASLAGEPGFLQRFIREINTLKQLNHPNIVRLLGTGQYKGSQYYIMEYVEGDTLDVELERRGTIPLDKALFITKEVSKALDYSHQKGIIHRDIKPANIMLGLDGQVKLTDFGIAKVLAATRMTKTGGVVGTAEYMSPEQAEGRVLDRRCDIYSLGVVLYRMLTGVAPFTGNTAVELMQQHRYSLPESPKELNPDLPMSVVNLIVTDMMAKAPAARIATAKALILKIEKIEEDIKLRSSGALRKAHVLDLGEVELSRLGEQFRSLRKYVPLLVGVAILALGVYLVPRIGCSRRDDAESMFESAMVFKSRKSYEKAKAELWRIKNFFPDSKYAQMVDAQVIELDRLVRERDLGKKQNALIRYSEDIVGTKYLNRALRQIEAGDYENARKTLESILVLFADQGIQRDAGKYLRQVQDLIKKSESIPEQEDGSGAAHPPSEEENRNQ